MILLEPPIGVTSATVTAVVRQALQLVQAPLWEAELTDAMIVATSVASIPEEQPLVLFRRAQQPERRTDRCFERIDEIGSAAGHERGDLEVP